MQQYTVLRAHPAALHPGTQKESPCSGKRHKRGIKLYRKQLHREQQQRDSSHTHGPGRDGAAPLPNGNGSLVSLPVIQLQRSAPAAARNQPRMTMCACSLHTTQPNSLAAHTPQLRAGALGDPQQARGFFERSKTSPAEPPPVTPRSLRSSTARESCRCSTHSLELGRPPPQVQCFDRGGGHLGDESRSTVAAPA